MSHDTSSSQTEILGTDKSDTFHDPDTWATTYNPSNLQQVEVRLTNASPLIVAPGSQVTAPRDNPRTIAIQIINLQIAFIRNLNDTNLINTQIFLPILKITQISERIGNAMVKEYEDRIRELTNKAELLSVFVEILAKLESEQ